MLRFVQEADASRSVTRRVDDKEIPDAVPVGEYPVRRVHRGTCTEMKRQGFCIARETGSVQSVDADTGVAHPGNLVEVGDMVEMAMGKDDLCDRVPVSLEGSGKNPCIHQDMTDDVGVAEEATAWNPPDRHGRIIRFSHPMSVMPSLIHECLSGLPELVEDVARKEGISPRIAARSVARGRLVIPANPNRHHRTCGIGEGCRVKVNVNVGTSGPLCDLALEEAKARAALENGADTLMDLSTGGDLRAIRRMLLSLDVPVGTVPVYEAVRRAGSAADVDADLLFSVIREHCRDGVDFLTLHCGVNRDVLSALRTDPRIMPVVSRGGAFHVAMMVQRDEENPLYEEFDYLLEILSEYGVVASLGDGMRPGCLQDAERHAKTVEYLTLGRLAGRALEAGVQRMIEGPGHVPLPQVPCNVQAIKELSNGAPLYLLGPIVTDLAPGYDHVVSAIGGAVAAMQGADFLCMVSPSEHLALPNVDDIVEGTRVARIAAHIGDISRHREGYRAARELQMAEARQKLDWNAMFSLALFGDHARRIHERDGESETCSMCGDLCAVKLVREIFRRKGE